ncbi:hypothetical protein [Bradyrhizobium sp. NBAIM14]|uniref:hypothetical protein n=1 Tax=Bradyrhizobium sp. NBAIM14 TaxID=2793814 RepID=UPI001CD2EBA7|nr:hypothetical protein [Bradyrhizobium sp. NBAIM14]MCA1499235.1 hypothetical protein [Bradyrhizobium sp. NBAIM14]
MFNGQASPCPTRPGGALDVASFQESLARLHLHIEAVGRPMQFYVLVSFDDDFVDAGRSGAQQAVRQIEVLIQEATMHRFDTHQLARIEHVWFCLFVLLGHSNAYFDSGAIAAACSNSVMERAGGRP